jgi:hypothetical protein
MTLTFGFGLEAVKAETIPRRIGFGAFALFFLLTGIFWVQIKEISPTPLIDAVDSVGTNPVAWFVVFMFIAMVVAFHRPRQRPAPPAILPPPSKPPARPAERVFIDVSPVYLMDLYEGKTSVQGDALAAAYLGKWLRIHAPIKDVSFFSDHYSISLKVGTELLKDTAALTFGPSWNDRIAGLRKGEQISARGRIEKIDSMRVWLEDCEIVDDPR